MYGTLELPMTSVSVLMVAVIVGVLDASVMATVFMSDTETPRCWLELQLERRGDQHGAVPPPLVEATIRFESVREPISGTPRPAAALNQRPHQRRGAPCLGEYCPSRAHSGASIPDCWRHPRAPRARGTDGCSISRPHAQRGDRRRVGHERDRNGLHVGRRPRGSVEDCDLEGRRPQHQRPVA